MKSIKKFLRKNLNNITIILYIISIIIFAINLFGRIGSSLLTSIGCIFTAMATTFLIHDCVNQPKRGFEFVSTNNKKGNFSKIPTRSSIYSAGYDFYADKDYDVKPNEIIKIWTDVKAYMQRDEVLLLDVRSSMGGKFMLANTIGIIDSDYYNNENNEGNIGIFLKNISNETQYIACADRIAQGIFIKYLTTDNDNIKKERKGGFGSSGQ